MITLARLVLSWLYSNAQAKIYSSPSPVGRRLGGRDAANWPDEYVILDVRAAGKIIVLGYFQLS